MSEALAEEILMRGMIAAIPLVIAAVPTRAQETIRSASRAQPRSVSEVLAAISRSAGVVVLADSTIRGRVTPPAAPGEQQKRQGRQHGAAAPGERASSVRRFGGVGH